MISCSKWYVKAHRHGAVLLHATPRFTVCVRSEHDIWRYAMAAKSSAHAIASSRISIPHEDYRAQRKRFCDVVRVVPLSLFSLPMRHREDRNSPKRQTILLNLLQSNSMSMPGRTIGHARFLIGGDMNTAPHLLSGVLQICREKNVLHTEERVFEPRLGMREMYAFKEASQQAA